MKPNYIIALLIFQFLFNSCGCIQTDLSKSERKWCSAYTYGSVVIFKSNFGNIDSLKVTELEEGITNEDCNRLVGKTQQNYIAVKLKLKKCKDENCDIQIAIYKKKVDKIAFPFFNVFGLEYDPIIQKNKLFKRKVILSNTNKTYDCYTFKDSINARSYGSIKAFDYSIENGIVRYETAKGEVFELMNK